MYSFLISLVVLIVGYMVYGLVVEKVFGIDRQRVTPAVRLNDGVDFVPMSWPRIFLIQLLNIAGLGPIFGAIMGALFGPAAFLWIVFGGIFAGAVHDYLSGMISLRHDGKSVTEIVGIYLGENIKKIMIVFSVVLLILVGTVFISGPAGLLANLGMTGIFANKIFWVAIIVIYYFLATMLPIDKIIGKIYPIFGIALSVMALGIAGVMIFNGAAIPEITLSNLHPKGLPIWPMMFITIACGAISGFHATQSPLMARCIKSEHYGRHVFYGAMIAESVIALIWAAAAIVFFNGVEGLNAALAKGGPSFVVNEISMNMLGTVGGILALLGVVACPITSGDTAFRSARLVIADAFKIDQKSIKSRLLLSIPLLAIGYALTLIDFAIIWRYFAWANQTLAMVMLWAGAVYLVKNKRLHWMASIPATFMTGVVTTYILQAPEGFQLTTTISYPVGIVVALLTFGLFAFKFLRSDSEKNSDGCCQESN